MKPRYVMPEKCGIQGGTAISGRSCTPAAVSVLLRRSVRRGGGAVSVAADLNFLLRSGNGGVDSLDYRVRIVTDYRLRFSQECDDGYAASLPRHSDFDRLTVSRLQRG